jgi:hypothetical protein
VKTCDERELDISQHVSGELSEEEVKELMAHIDSPCEVCRATLAAFQDLDMLMAGAREGEPDPEQAKARTRARLRGIRRWNVLKLAALAVVLAGLVLWLGRNASRVEIVTPGPEEITDSLPDADLCYRVSDLVTATHASKDERERLEKLAADYEPRFRAARKDTKEQARLRGLVRAEMRAALGEDKRAAFDDFLKTMR